MKISNSYYYVFLLFLVMAAITLYTGRDIPPEEYERAIVINKGIRSLSDSLIATYYFYNDNSVIECKYIVDPKHHLEAWEALKLNLYQEHLSYREEANMLCRWHHIKYELGCKYLDRSEEK